MNKVRLATLGFLATVLWAGAVSAQAVPSDFLRQPITLTGATDSGYSLAADGAVPPAPPGTAAAKTDETKKDADKKDEETKGEETTDEEKEWKLFHGPWLECHRIDVRGWLDQGFTANFWDPTNKFNGPMGYNDRANEYQLNQLYMIAERVTKVENNCGMDVGGRVDMLFGTDHRFTQVTPGTGFDDTWETSRFYGFSMPQAYGDLQINRLIIRAGHFLYPCGAESVMAPDNFFYSHSYTFLYAQPTSLTGGMLKFMVTDKLAILGGIDTGWNNFESPNDKIGFFTGFNWTSKDEKTTANFVITFNNQQPTGVESTRTHYCLCFTRKLSEKWTGGLETDYGTDSFSAAAGTDAEWASVIPYLTYEINKCWAVGFRYEWLRDNRGIIIAPPSDPFVPFPGDWNDLTWGVRYTPNKNVMVRSEVRYDWATSLAPALPANERAFDDNTKNYQWTWATDLIVKF